MTIKIVNGKRYNTETSSHIAELSSSNDVNCAWTRTNLYVTKKGNFFTLFEKKGEEGHTRFDCEEVTPITEEEAIGLLQNAMENDNITYEEMLKLQPYFTTQLDSVYEDA